MDKAKLIGVLETYGTDLERYEPRRAESPWAGSVPMQRQHLRWMLGQIKEFAEAGRMEKAMRWLGFVQGVLWSTNFYSLDELKSHNMPAGESLEPDRI